MPSAFSRPVVAWLCLPWSCLGILALPCPVPCLALPCLALSSRVGSGRVGSEKYRWGRGSGRGGRGLPGLRGDCPGIVCTKGCPRPYLRANRPPPPSKQKGDKASKTILCNTTGLRRGGLTPACGFAHVRNGRGCRQNEVVNAAVLPRGALRIFHG